MTERSPRLYPERASAAAIRSALDQHGFDLVHEMLRADYLTSPFPNRETVLPRLERLEPALQALLLLFTFGEPLSPESIRDLLGADLLEAGLASGLLVLDRDETHVSTGGLQIVSRLGQYFIVSTSVAIRRSIRTKAISISDRSRIPSPITSSAGPPACPRPDERSTSAPDRGSPDSRSPRFAAGWSGPGSMFRRARWRPPPSMQC